MVLMLLALFLSGISFPTARYAESQCESSNTTPKKLAPGIVSQEGRYEFGSSLNSDCTELYIGIDHGGWLSVELYVRSGDEWVYSHRIAGSPDARANDPYVSMDDQRLYFILERDNQRDIVYLEREGAGTWSEPRFEAPPVNSDKNEFYISFERNGDLVFASNRDALMVGDFNLYRAIRQGDRFVEIQPFPEGINTPGYEADPFIDPDGKFLLFASNRSGGLGRGDIYISFNQGDQDWTTPQPVIELNTENHELCPYITTDGSTLYYTSNEDLYYVDASILDAYRP